MYAKSIAIYGFKCFGKAEVDFLYPGQPDVDPPIEHPNINLILGDNGGGKSSVLRAVAIAILAPALSSSGFVPYRLVRRTADGGLADNTILKVEGIIDPSEVTPEFLEAEAEKRRPWTAEMPRDFIARLKANARSQIDQLSLESTPNNPVADLLHDDFSPAFFVVGYGATRRVETGAFGSSNEDRRRSRRYQRVASLFEDHVAVRPMQAWYPMLTKSRQQEVLKLLASALPENIEFKGEIEGEDYVFAFDGVPTPFPALSDGYKAFVGWVSDLIGHMTSVAGKRRLRDLTGIVLVDEIDLHLHPSWQRDVIARLARAFPRLQFIFTSHSPLVAASVQSRNVVVTGTDDAGLPTLERMQESLYGRSVEAVLMSPYFGLDSARPKEAREATAELAARTAAKPGGDVNAAEEFLRQLAQPIERLRKKAS